MFSKRWTIVEPPPFPDPDAEIRRLHAAAALVLGIPAFWAMGLVMRALQARLPDPPDARSLLAGMLPLHVGMTAVLAAAFLAWHPGRRWLPALELGRPPEGWRATIRSSLLMLAWGYPVAAGLYEISGRVAHWCGYQPPESPLVGCLLAEKNIGWLVLAVAGMTVLAPLAEELIFRLALHDSFRLFGLPPGAAAWGTAAAFAAVHCLPAEIPALLFLGLLFQWRRERDRSLWGAVVLHAGVNAASLALLLSCRRFFPHAG
jgi:membrane protease YdiL (CAAX protease family)